MLNKLILKIFLLVLPALSMAHGGGLDGNGGHYNRKTGEYHCHRAPCFSQKESTSSLIKNSSYNRDNWKHWVDVDGDCQNTRAEILISSSRIPVTFSSEKHCAVDSGEWLDVYTGQIFTTASLLDIDHIVPLKEAYISGGATWSAEKKEDFANDPLNLIAVSASENREKGSGDVAEWLPDNIEYRCAYVQHFVAVKEKYNLRSDEVEKTVIEQVLSSCQ